MNSRGQTDAGTELTVVSSSQWPCCAVVVVVVIVDSMARNYYCNTSSTTTTSSTSNNAIFVRLRARPWDWLKAEIFCRCRRFTKDLTNLGNNFKNFSVGFIRVQRIKIFKYVKKLRGWKLFSFFSQFARSLFQYCLSTPGIPTVCCFNVVSFHDGAFYLLFTHVPVRT